MTCIICDSCKKSIPGPKREGNYHTLLNKDLCSDCFSRLEENAIDLMSRESDFQVNTYNSHRKTLLAKMTR